MRALVRAITLRRVLLEPGRSALLVLGVALGVAVVVAVRALNHMAIDTIGQVGKVATGSAAYVVEGGAAGVPIDLLPRLRAIQGVASASAVVARPAREVGPSGGGSDAAKDEAARRVLVLGLDLLDPAAREQAAARDVGVVVDPLVFASTTSPAIVGAPFARRRGLAPGGRFELYLAGGRRAFVVAGVFDPQGPAAAATGGDVVVLPLALALEAFGTPGRADRLAIALADGADGDAVLRELRAAVAPAFDATAPGGDQGVRPEALLGTMQLGLEIASLLALMIGQFLIYNATSIAIVRRRPEIGILRAVGTTRAQLLVLLLSETAVFGLVGAGAGLVLGWLLAEGARGLVNEQVSQMYAAIDARGVKLTTDTILLGLASGPIATVLAALPPVLSALGVSPVEAARKDPPRRRGVGAITILAGVGALLLLFAFGCFVATEGGGQGLVAGAALQLAIACGAAALAPWLLVQVLRALRPAIARLLGPTGALAADGLLARPGRAGVTVAALLVALGGVLAIAALVASLERTITGWVQHVLVADLYAAASTQLGSQTNTLLEYSVRDELLSVEGVAEVYPIRFAFERVEPRKGAGLAEAKPALIVALDMGFLGGKSTIPIKGSIPGGLKAGTDAIVSEPDRYVAISANLSRARGIGVGDRIAVNTPQGEWRPEVVLVIVDYTSDHGCVYVNRPEFWRRWGDTRVNAFDIFCRPGSTPEQIREVAATMRARFGGRYDLFVTENAAFREKILVVVQSAFSVTFAMQLVAIGVALLGVVTTLFAAILERTRELGVLRAVGATRGQLARAVVTEAFLLGALAAGFAAPTGALLGLALVTRVISGTYGWELEFTYPWGQAAVGAVVASLLAALAGLLPAARAARIEIVRALAYD